MAFSFTTRDSQRQSIAPKAVSRPTQTSTAKRRFAFTEREDQKQSIDKQTSQAPGFRRTGGARSSPNRSVSKPSFVSIAKPQPQSILPEPKKPSVQRVSRVQDTRQALKDRFGKQELEQSRRIAEAQRVVRRQSSLPTREQLIDNRFAKKTPGISIAKQSVSKEREAELRTLDSRIQTSNRLIDRQKRISPLQRDVAKEKALIKSRKQITSRLQMDVDTTLGKNGEILFAPRASKFIRQDKLVSFGDEDDLLFSKQTDIIQNPKPFQGPVQPKPFQGPVQPKPFQGPTRPKLKLDIDTNKIFKTLDFATDAKR